MHDCLPVQFFRFSLFIFWYNPFSVNVDFLLLEELLLLFFFCIFISLPLIRFFSCNKKRTKIADPTNTKIHALITFSHAAPFVWQVFALLYKSITVKILWMKAWPLRQMREEKESSLQNFLFFFSIHESSVCVYGYRLYMYTC